MKKILLMQYEFLEYDKVVIEELKSQGYTLTIFNLDEEKYKKARKIKNPFLRIYNDKYLKKYKGINLKDKLEAREMNKDLLKITEKFDCFLKIGPFALHEETLKLIKTKAKIMISHHWDSIDFCSNHIKTKLDIELEKRYFDKISSYSKEDCIKYSLKYLPNFYIETDSLDIENDIYTIMSDTSKKKLLENIYQECKENLIKANLNLLVHDDKIESKYINILRKGITVKKMLENVKKSKCILEINKEISKGYTFRTFDAIGLKKKLITTNKNIVEEEYNPNNILVLNENNINISKDFVDSPYEDLPKEIYEKYNLENWVKQLMKIEDN